MAIWWPKAAKDIATLRKSGVECPEEHIPELQEHRGPSIETSYRQVETAPRPRPAPAAAPAAQRPRRQETGLRFEGRLMGDRRRESFLAEGARRKNHKSWL
ncbi:MAG TPA: hypothetical protein PK286_10955 [Devosia sp.]|nr:hypothetical protein [Devosia sp.]